MTIDNVTVIIESGALSAKEAERYIRKIQRHSKGRTLKRVSFRLADGHLDLRYAFEGIPFERIRRITGYLVGTLERFNDAKRAEEHDRVKHAGPEPCPR